MEKRIGVLPLMAFVCSVSAQTPSCPPQSVIQQAEFVEAILNPYDKEQWNFRTGTIQLNGMDWYIEFGSFFKNVINEEHALLLGQRYFSEVSIKIPNPKPVAIPKHLLCDYMPEGRAYWISALHPL